MSSVDVLGPAVFGVLLLGAFRGVEALVHRWRAPQIPVDIETAMQVLGKAFAREMLPSIKDKVRDEIGDVLVAMHRDREERGAADRLLIGVVERLSEVVDALRTERKSP